MFETPVHIRELAKNIRRNVKHMARDIPMESPDAGKLLDYLNHIDTLAQQIEESD